VKIFGVFTIKRKTSGNVHVMVMENTMQIKDPNCLKFVYDLKGSLIGRSTEGTVSPGTILKDGDLVNIKSRFNFKQHELFFKR